MREQLRDSGRLQHIIEAIDNIFEFTNGITFDEYCRNKMMCFAVVKNIENIGEAANNLSKEFKAQYAEIEWKKIIAMRHVLVHGYYQISNEEAWNTVINDIPPFQEQIKRIMDNL
jgi:uncharacterized protein with HEPN domain